MKPLSVNGTNSTTLRESKGAQKDELNINSIFNEEYKKIKDSNGGISPDKYAKLIS